MTEGSTDGGLGEALDEIASLRRELKDLANAAALDAVDLTSLGLEKLWGAPYREGVRRPTRHEAAAYADLVVGEAVPTLEALHGEIKRLVRACGDLITENDELTARLRQAQLAEGEANREADDLQGELNDARTALAALGLPVNPTLTLRRELRRVVQRLRADVAAAHLERDATNAALEDWVEATYAAQGQVERLTCEAEAEARPLTAADVELLRVATSAIGDGVTAALEDEDEDEEDE